VEAECIVTISSYPEGSFDRCETNKDPAPTVTNSVAATNASEQPWDLCLVLTVQRLDPEQSHLTGSITLQAQEGFIKRLLDAENNRVVNYDAVEARYVVNPTYARSAIEVQILELAGRTTISKSVMLGDLFPSDGHTPGGVLPAGQVGPCGREYGVEMLIDLDLASHPLAYPHDWYTADTMVEVVLPPGLSLGVVMEDFGTLVPFTLFVNAGTELGDNVLRVNHRTVKVSYGPLMRNLSFASIQLVFTRDPQTQFFVYGVSVVPFALFIVLLTFVPTQRGDQLWNVLFGIGAGFLAVLPLRQVLVPDEVPGLTRVDFILGAELTVMVALFLGLRALFWNRPPANEGHPPRDYPTADGLERKQEYRR
jgi:hypothetical protein